MPDRCEGLVKSSEAPRAAFLLRVGFWDDGITRVCFPDCLPIGSDSLGLYCVLLRDSKGKSEDLVLYFCNTTLNESPQGKIS